MIRKTLQSFSSFIQRPTDSYKRHNAEYEAPGKIDLERREGMDKIRTDVINGPNMRVRDLLTQHPNVRVAVDIGSGTGWSAAALSPLVDSVIAIEPSVAAIEMAKSIYPLEKYGNITWSEGFAEVVIPRLNLTKPCLFLTGCVLSHLRDEEVQTICSQVNTLAPTGSVLSFDECWGNESWHQIMWHVRTKDWWQRALSNWELNFHGPEVPEKDAYKGRYHKGIHGVKVR